MSTGSVFEIPDRLPKSGDSAAKMSPETHLGVLDDMHLGAQHLVPSFAHSMAGMRQSFESANQFVPKLELDNTAMAMAANAGGRWNNNSDAINAFFRNDDAAKKADASFQSFLDGRSDTATVAHVNNRFTNPHQRNA